MSKIIFSIFAITIFTACQTFKPVEKKLVWIKPEETSGNLAGYRIYLMQPKGEKGKLLIQVNDPNKTEVPLGSVLKLLETSKKNTVYVVAIDRSGNESPASETVCIGHGCQGN